jgi:hypothetical protein
LTAKAVQNQFRYAVVVLPFTLETSLFINMFGQSPATSHIGGIAFRTKKVSAYKQSAI